ncbi:prepilin-type N-terminal cleavage/methylation domain-containing protein [Aromatoleum diolicum]|uniref:Prepilin-type N-terminal cleavage/methylation domain-containing protein n=2 Tax=Aromatoleum diolicum TaxID=75796 RepID=A0ABX1Q723_9RHOO|nr:prepilin-type N-terminal cleavage/methylation domain-containing protein [Aromatoleum diolicum]
MTSGNSTRACRDIASSRRLRNDLHRSGISACRGFTLIELMIAVVVVAILAAIAIPSYSEYIRRSRITEATNELATLRIRLEQYYQDNRNYGSTASSCGVGVASTDSFVFSCSNNGADSQQFLATATGKGAVGMAGFSFTVDHNNNRQTTAFPGASGLPLNCWITRQGGTC